MKNNGINKEYASLTDGDHICLLYENIEDYKYVAIRYIIDGLLNNEKILCVVHEYPMDILKEDLFNKDIDANEYIKSGQLDIVSINDIYLAGNGFDIDRTIGCWEKRQNLAMKQGYNGMRVLGEGIFALYEEKGIDKLIEYELRCNEFKAANHMFLCAYNKKEFPDFILENMVEIHNVLINDSEIIKPNPYYLGYDKLKEKYEKKVEMKKHLALGVSNKYPLGTNNIKKNREAAILKHVIGSTGDGIWEWDIQSSKIHLNENFLRILGYQNKEVIIESKDIMRLVHPEDSYGFRKQVERCFKNEIDQIDFELRIKNVEGSWIWFHIRGTLTERDHISGQALKAVGVFININDTRKIKDELDKKTYLEKVKTDYFTNLSHELRTPLNVIFGSLQLQQMFMKNDKSSEYIDKYNKIHKRMKQNCYRLLKLVNNVIDISRIDSGVYDLQLQNYNIVALINNIILSMKDYSQFHNLDIQFKSNIDEGFMACDPEKIERIMLNLLSNAIKFTDPGGKIKVKIDKKNDEIIISVKDTGIGIPEDKIKSIFNRFSQVDRSLQKSHQGSGIGLSLVKSFVDMHEGKITVASKQNKGTEFIIVLPIRTVEDTEENNSIIEISQTNVERMQIEFSDIYVEEVNYKN